jgi:hypothetical protein
MPLTFSDIKRLLPAMNDRIQSPMSLPIDAHQSWLDRDQLIAEYQALRPEALKRPKSLGANRTLDRLKASDIVISAGSLRRWWEYDGAAMTAGVFQTKDIRTGFVLDARHGIPVVVLFTELSPIRAASLFRLMPVTSQQDWHFVDPSSGDMSAKLVFNGRDFVFPR